MSVRKNKKVIFFLINSLESGGAERVLSNILPKLTQKYNIYLILLKNKIFYNVPSNIKVIPLTNVQNNILLPFLLPFYIFKLKKLIKQYQPAKVISFLEIANFVNIFSQQKAIVSFRTSLEFFQGSLIKIVYRFLINKLYPRAKLIIVNSRENKIDLLRRLKLRPTQITTIYNPVQIKTTPEPVTVKLPFQRQKFKKIFISVGRLDKQKNFSTLIQAFKIMPTQYALLIIGDGAEKERLQRLIRELNLSERTFLLGRQKNVFAYLNLADYFIFSSRAEGFPNVLIEAMACRLPIITSDFRTGAREIIDPRLDFEQKISYPYYGSNGVLLSLANFKNGLAKVDLNKVKQEQQGLEKFQLTKIIKQWEKIINL